MLESLLVCIKNIMIKDDYQKLNLIHSFWNNCHQDETFLKICKDSRESLKSIVKQLLKERNSIRRIHPMLTGSFQNGKSSKLQIIHEDAKTKFYSKRLL
jgi:hypothetical protein